MSSAQLLKVCVWDFNMDNRIPLFLEFAVDQHLSPFLVSSSSSLIWVRKTRNGCVRAALRPLPENVGVFYREVIQAVCTEGLELHWGNVHNLDESGIKAAIQHVTSYGFEEIDILVHSTLPVTWKVPDNAQVVEVDWLEEGYLVVVPRDRDFVGFIATVDNLMFSVIHNAARGIAVARLPYERVAGEPTEEPGTIRGE